LAADELAAPDGGRGRQAYGFGSQPGILKLPIRVCHPAVLEI
jgi:hypothetical protein